MRSLYLLAAGGGLGALLACGACGSNVTDATGSGGTSSSSGHGGASSVSASSASSGGFGGGDTSTVASVSSVAATSSSAGTGGVGGNPHGSFDTAQPVDVGVTLMEDLPAGASDYFVFTGTKGQALDIEAIAQYLDAASPSPFDPTYLDTVVSLYDAGQHKIAEDNDLQHDGNDADLFTVLPADGTYYVRVTECWTWSAESGKTCAAPQQKTHTQYSLQIYAKDPSQANVVEDPIPDTGDTPATATPFKFAKNGATAFYRRTDTYGFFQGAADVDWFSFVVPADAPVSQGRLTEYLYFQGAGTAHDGSTEGIGAVTVTDAAGVTVLARVNGSTGQQIEVPVTAGQQYLVSVARNDGLVGSNDFYAFFSFPGGSNLLEAHDATNGALAGAEPLTAVTQGAGGSGFFSAGDLTPAATDVDWYAAAVPANLPAGTTVSAGCDGQYLGSGLVGLKATLVDAGGNTLATGTETSTLYAYTPKVAVPAGATSVFLKVSAASQDATNTGTYYACGVYFLPP